MDRTPPLVSILLAAYRTEPRYLRDALDSVQRQLVPDFELIVSDDSPDDSLRAVVENYGDVRIRYCHNVPALGVAANHIAMLEQARGRFCAILNHDDRWEPRFLAELTAKLEACPDAVVAFCDHWLIDAAGLYREEASNENSRRFGRAQLAEGLHRPFPDLVAAQAVPLAMGAVMRREAINIARLKAESGPAYDLYLTYLLAATGGGAYYCAERLSCWRTHETNISGSGSLSWNVGSAICWEDIEADSAMAQIRKMARIHAAGALRTSARICLRQGRRREGRIFAARSMRYRPHWKGAALWGASFIH